MKKLIIMLFVVIAFLQTQAQDSANDIKTLIDTKSYVFEPTNVTPSRGRVRYLTPGYFLQVKNDTLKVYLPYFGRAYTAPIDPSDAGYNFTTTDYEYAVSKGKKDSYKISIKTKDKVYNSDFYLTVYDNGTAYLQANSSNRQSISYNGNIKEKK